LKRILVGDNREELLSTLEVILKNWGYRVLVTSSPDGFTSMLNDLSPDLIIAGPTILSNSGIQAHLKGAKAPLLILQDSQIKPIRNLAGEPIDYPVDIFKLFESVQKYLETIPRKNIRIKVQMPSMYYHGNIPCIAEVISLSVEGMFIKTGSRIDGLDQVRIVLPLIGMQKEIELEGKVIYTVEPLQRNNYQQGMGIQFCRIDSENEALLQKYVENLLVSELSEHNDSENALDLSQLHSQPIIPTLNLLHPGT